MIKYFFGLQIICGFISPLPAQQNDGENFREGKVSYISNKNIYVQFESAEGFSVGDTLFKKKGEIFFAAVKIVYLSSRSVAGSKLGDEAIQVGEPLFGLVKLNQTIILANDSLSGRQSILSRENELRSEEKNIPRKELLKGRATLQSVSAFTNLQNDEKNYSSRATLSLKFHDEALYKLSGNFYGNFNSISSGAKKNSLKIFDFNAIYKYDSLTTLTLGRFINAQLNSAGTADGFSLERNFSYFNAGIFIGSRPAYIDYGFDFKLFQMGIFAARSDSVFNSETKNSISFFNQTNNFNTDRRFLSFQHTNSFIPNSFLFLLTEADLYQNTYSKKGASFRLTSFHSALRTNISRQISASVSYDARKNIFYYETFKTYLDSTFTDNTRHTLRFGMTLRFIDKLFVNLNSSYGIRTDEARAATNYYALASYSEVPILNAAASASINFLRSGFSTSSIGGLRIYRDFFNGELFTSLNYRHVEYEFSSSSSKLLQNIFNCELSVRLPLAFYLSANYEGIFQKTSTYSRILIDLTKRF